MSLLPRHATLPSNAQLSALLDGVDSLLLLFDGRGRVSYRNPAAQRLLGCEPGQPVAVALARLDLAQRSVLLAAMAGGSAAQIPQAAQTLVPLRITLAPGTGPQVIGPTGGPTVAPTIRPTIGPTIGPPSNQGAARPLDLPATLERGPGGGWMLRSTAAPAPAPVQVPPLAAGATSELIRLLWDTPQPLLVQDTRFISVAANRAFFEAVALRPDQVLGRDLLDGLPAADQQAVLAARATWAAALAAGHQPAQAVEQRLPAGPGGARWFRSTPRWVSADDGAPLLLALLHDVTPEHLARDAAEQTGRELASWFDLSPIGLLVYAEDGTVLRHNPAAQALLGPLPGHLADCPADLQQLLGWAGDGLLAHLRDDPTALELRGNVSVAGGPPQRLRARLRGFAGGAAGLCVMAVLEDRSLEEEHDLARLEIGALMDTASVGVATYEASRGWLNSRPARTAGSTAGGVAGAAAGPLAANSPAAGATLLPPPLVDAGSVPAGGLQAVGRDQVEPGSRDEFERLQRALRDGRRAQVRYAVNMPDLGLRWLLTRVEPGELAGGRATLSVVTLDVTEQEEAHRRGEQLLRELSTILEGTSAGIAYLRGERLVRCNRRFEAMLGLATGGAAGALLADVLAEHPAALAVLRQALADEGRFETELRRTGADGQPLWLALSASHAPAGGAPELVVVLTDVSRLKVQQAELEALARERALMFNLSDVGLSYLRAGQIQRANEALAALTGYAVGELLGMHLSALFSDEAAYQQALPQQQLALQQSGRWRGERRLRRRDGRLIWVQVSKRRVDDADADADLICSYVDVDERRRAREAVQLQAERTRAILDSVLVGIVTVGDGGIEWMNRSARRMCGGELADFVGEPISIVATSDPDHPLRATHYRQALGDGQAETFECRLRARDGREFWVVGNAVVTGRGDVAPPSQPTGRGSQITFALLDIDSRRQAEVRIAQAQASLQGIIDTAPLAIALFDADSGRVLRLNQMAAMFFGRPMEAVLGRPTEEWFGALDAQLLQADLAAALAQPDGLRREWQRPVSDRVAGTNADHPDHADHADHASSSTSSASTWDMRIVSLDSGSGPQLLLVASDVTEQRVAEQARFDAAVSQREMLVKEVHHRIKNNLQGVAGLLQQTAARRPEVAALISEAVGQVQAIAQVHGLQVGVSGPLRILPLIEAITASVQRTFGRAVLVQVQGTPPHRFALPEAESIPIALTINELLTNAIKHSAPGEIRCVLHCDEARLAISVYNPGQLKAGFSLAQVPPGVSGLGLVRALLPRRTATLTLLQDGTEVAARIVLVPPSISLLEPL